MAESLGRAVLTLAVDNTQYNAGLEAAKSSAVRSGDEIQGVFSRLGQTLQGLAGIAGIVGLGAISQQIISTGKASQSAEIQLQALAGAYGEAAAAQTAVERVQRVLGISAVDASNGFAQLYAALRGTGVNLQQLEVLFVGVSNAARLSGAGAQEASAALLQLKQGLASGRLQGDELRSVLEQLPALAQAIAAEMNVNVGALRQLGSDGKITSDIIFNAAKRLADATVPGRAQVEQLGIAFENLKAQVAKGFGPGTTEVLTTLSAGVIAFTRYLKDNSENLTNFAKGVVNLGKTLAPFVVGIMAVRAAMNAWAIASKAAAVAQAAVIALTGPKGWAVLAGAAAATAGAAFALDQAMKGVEDATKGARLEAEQAIASFKELLSQTTLAPTDEPDEKKLNKKRENAGTIAKQNALYEIQLQQRQRQIGYAKELASVEAGALRSTIEQGQQIQEQIQQALDAVRELGASIDGARIAGVDTTSAEFQKLVNDQKIAAEDVRIKLIEGSTALKDAGVQLRKDLTAAIEEFTAVRSDPKGLNKYLDPDTIRQREIANLKLLRPSFQRARADFKKLTGVEAPQFRGPVASVNEAMRNFIKSVEREKNASKNLENINEALSKNTSDLARVNETLGTINFALAEQIGNLASKDWTVQVNVNGSGGAQVLGDVNSALS